MHFLKKLYPLILVSLLSGSCSWNIYNKNAPDIYVADPSFKVVGYLDADNFDLIDQIELERLTYLNLAFANLDENGKLVFPREQDIGKIVEKGHQAGLKVFLSIAGGGIRGEEKSYWYTVLQPSNRAEFINEIIAYVNRYNFDGVDVDIEGNLLLTIGKLYNPFVLALAKALHVYGKGISSALDATELPEAISQEVLEAYDFINVMAYDATGIWKPDKPGPHAPYSYAEQAVLFWMDEKKIPGTRLVLGVPFYGYDFEAVKYIPYSKVVENNPTNAYKDEVNATYYNGIPTIVKKTQLTLEKLNGVMIWELGYDAFDDLSLLRAIDQTIKAGDCNGGKLSTYFADFDGDGFGEIAKPMQACSPPRGYVNNHQDCDDAHENIHPGADEVKDGKDNNCNGKIDE